MPSRALRMGSSQALAFEYQAENSVPPCELAGYRTDRWRQGAAR